ncbi:MAG: polysaccharide deacetylase family protein [Bdellovibrionota bacterium]
MLASQASGATIGSHTLTHQFLDNIPVEAVQRELQYSKHELQRMLGKDIIAFAYPSGIYTDEVIQMVKEAGYALAFTTDEGINYTDANLHKLKRINIWDDFVCNNTGQFSASLTLWRLLIS